MVDLEQLEQAYRNAQAQLEKAQEAVSAARSQWVRAHQDTYGPVGKAWRIMGVLYFVTSARMVVRNGKVCIDHRNVYGRQLLPGGRWGKDKLVRPAGVLEPYSVDRDGPIPPLPTRRGEL